MYRSSLGRALGNPMWRLRCRKRPNRTLRSSSIFALGAYKSGGWPTFTPPRTRLPHPSRLSKGEHLRPRHQVHASHTNTRVPCYLSHAQPTPPLLRSWIAALYHHQLLPPAPPAWRPAESPSVSAGTRTGPASLSFRGRWLRGHARAYPPLTGRTSARQSIAGDAGPQTRFCAASARQVAFARRSPARATVERASGSWPHLAAPLLRLCRVQREKACGETKLYAPQPGKARTGPRTGTVAMEQFPPLRLRRVRPRAGEPGPRGRNSE